MKKLDEDFVKRELEKEGFELLSSYVNANVKIRIRCPKQHISLKKYGNWTTGSRCVECFKEKLKNKSTPYSIIYIKDEFAKHNFILVSEKYVNARQKLEFICPQGHEGSITWNDFQQNKRCPECISSLKGENECRRIVEDFFKKSFIKVRLDLLRNPLTNRKLELDGYNEELKIAFEYNGRYHYEGTNTIELNKQKERDLMKKNLCEKNGIKLLIIPFWVKNIEKFLLEELKLV